MINVDLKSVFFLAQAFAKRALARGGGAKIVNVASVLAFTRRHPRAVLHGREARRCRSHQAAGERMGRQGHQRERDRARLCAHRRDAGAAGRSGAQRAAAVRAFRPAAGASPPTLAARRYSLSSRRSDYCHGTILVVDGGWLAGLILHKAYRQRGTPLRTWLGRICLTVMVLLAAIDIAAAQPKRILVLHSFGANFGPWNAISARLREELRKQSPAPIDLYENSLQAERSGDPPGERRLLAYLNGLFEDRNPDLIIVIGAPAARFVLRNRARIFSLRSVAHCSGGRACLQRQSTHRHGYDPCREGRSVPGHRQHPANPS